MVQNRPVQTNVICLIIVKIDFDPFKLFQKSVLPVGKFFDRDRDNLMKMLFVEISIGFASIREWL